MKKFYALLVLIMMLVSVSVCFAGELRSTTFTGPVYSKKKKNVPVVHRQVSKQVNTARPAVQNRSHSANNGMQPVSSSVGKPKKVDLNKVNEAANNFILGFAAACEQYSYDPVAPYVDERAEKGVKNMISSSRNAKFIYGKVFGSRVNNERHTVESLVWIKMGYDRVDNSTSTMDFASYVWFTQTEPYKVIGFSALGVDTAGGLFCPNIYNSFVVTHTSEVCGEPGGTVIGKVERGRQVYASGQVEAGGRIWIWGQAGGYGTSLYHDGIGWAWFPADCLAKEGL